MPVWDLPTRLFHWTLALCVVANLFVVEPEGGGGFLLHAYIGYAVAGLVAFRVLWGLAGSRSARFGDFVRPWPAVRTHMRRLLRRDLAPTVGHNPLGGWMIVLMLVVLAAQVATGLASGNRAGAGPLAQFAGGGNGLGDVHEVLGNVLIALVVVHLLGVVVESLLTRENLARAMVTGRKPTVGEGASIAGERILRRALVLGGMAAAGAAALAFLAPPSTDTAAGGAED
jgi:cytochrome b